MEWGEHLPQLEQLAARGLNPPALARRPSLPIWLQSAFDCYVDLRGDLDWMRVRAWALAHDEPLDDLWSVLSIAQIEVQRWQSARKALGSPPSASIRAVPSTRS